MIKFKKFPLFLSPYLYSKPSDLKQIFNDYNIELDYVWRYRFIQLSAYSTCPLRWIENSLFTNKIKQVKIKTPPVSILGHWRSGTTYLHYLLCQDPQFSYITNGQMYFGNFYFTLGRWLSKLLKYQVRRPMDNLPLSLDLAQEEEFCLSSYTQNSFYFHWLFPKETINLFNRYVLFKGVTEAEINEWKKTYHYLLQQTTLLNPNKILLLKNPPNTARVSTLLQQYPKMKFIFIHRDPYAVFRSTRHLFNTFSLNGIGLQKMTDKERDTAILHVYTKTMESYLEQREHIPKDQLVEIKYSDLDKDPMTSLNEIYNALNIQDWNIAEPLFKKYINSQNKYQKNIFPSDPEVIDLINSKCGKIFDSFGYEKISA